MARSSPDSARRRALLAMLALRPGATVSVDALCESLWSEHLPANAPGNLQSHVSLLGEGSVVLEPGGYRLPLDGNGTDVGQVEHAAREAEACRATAPAAAAASYQPALDRWRGPALVEFAGNPAFLPDIARLDELQRTLRDDLHEARLDAGEAPSALPAIERAPRDQPLRERSQLLVVRALHLSGARRRRYGRVTPIAVAWWRRPAWTRARRSSSSSCASSPANLSARPPRLPTPSPLQAWRGLPSIRRCRARGRFFGRERELDLLQRYLAFERLVTVIGAGGVGKTRLVAEALAARGSANRRIVVGLASAGDGEVVTAVARRPRFPGDRAGSARGRHRVPGAGTARARQLRACGGRGPRSGGQAHCRLPGITVLATSRSRLGLGRRAGAAVLRLRCRGRCGRLRARRRDGPGHWGASGVVPCG
jgi:Bacterial transcriptional activator domain